MPYLARSQENTQNHLGLIAVNSDGFLYDPETVSFRVKTAAGVHVFPGAGAYHEVTAAGKTGTGRYFAYDSDAGSGWTPEADATIGDYVIEWVFRDEDDAADRSWSQAFSVSGVGTGLPCWTYLTPQQVRDEGILAADLSDARLIKLILRIQQYIESKCRQMFRPHYEEVRLNGSGGSVMHLPTSLIGLDSVEYGRTTMTVLDTTLYAPSVSPALESAPGRPVVDHRRNPKLVLFGDASSDIFTFDHDAGGTFAVGTSGYLVKGVWGFLESDGTTPELISQAALRLALANGPVLLLGQTGSLVPGGAVKRERTDRHEIEYGVNSFTFTQRTSLATTPEVEEILWEYRAPRAMGATWSARTRVRI